MSIFPPPNTWQMMTFLNPLDALIPKIPFSFFCRSLGAGHLWGPRVSLGRILGGPSVEPPPFLWGGGGPARGLYRHPPPQLKACPPQGVVRVVFWGMHMIRGWTLGGSACSQTEGASPGGLGRPDRQSRGPKQPITHLWYVCGMADLLFVLPYMKHAPRGAREPCLQADAKKWNQMEMTQNNASRNEMHPGVEEMDLLRFGGTEAGALLGGGGGLVTHLKPTFLRF